MYTNDLEDALRTILVAGFVVAVALAVPAGAAAWTPEDCAAWYAEHGSNHPDCQSYVPPEVTPPVVTPPPVVEQPPPVVTPPVVTPPVVPPTVEDVPPVDAPNVVPGVAPKVEHKAPNEVEGKEQQTPAPAQKQVVDTRTTLPFSGLSVGWVAALGAVLLAGGAACRRRIA